MEVKGENYRVSFDAARATVEFEGVLHLGGVSQYASIERLLDTALASAPHRLTLDFTELQFLDDSGINILYKFAIATRKKTDFEVMVRMTESISWQATSLPNLVKYNADCHLIKT